MEAAAKTKITASPHGSLRGGGPRWRLISGPAVETKVVKPGWRSSELWVTLGLPAALQLLTSASHVAGPWGMLAGAIASGLYSLSRGLAKK